MAKTNGTLFDMLYKDHIGEWRTRKGISRGIRFRKNYVSFYHPEDDSFWIRYMCDWDMEETPPVIAKVYRNGNVWFHPHMSMRDTYKYTIEDRLLSQLLPGIWFEMNRNRLERGVRIKTLHKVLIPATAGSILFNRQGHVLSCLPPRTRKQNLEAIAAYDALATKVRKDTKLRAKLDILEIDKDRVVWWMDSESFHKELQKVDVRKLRTFEQLAFWAQHHARPTDTHISEAIDRMFVTMRPKVLEHIGAVSYT